MKRALLVTAGCLMVCGAGASWAHGRPTANVTLPPEVTAGQGFSFPYTTSGIPRGGRIYIQRQEGTAHVWRNVVSLPIAHRGTGAAAALSMGRFKFRVVIFVSGRMVSSTSAIVVSSYGTIPLGELLPSDAAIAGPQGSVLVGSNTFNFIDGTSFDDTEELLSSNATSCRSLSIDIGAPANTPANIAAFPGANDWTWTATVYQQTADPVSATVGPGQTATLNANIVPGQSWDLSATFAGTNPNATSPDGVLINGTASCYALAQIEEPNDNS